MSHRGTSWRRLSAAALLVAASLDAAARAALREFYPAAAAIELGPVRQGAPAVRIVLTVRNEGDDVLARGPITVPDGFAVSQPPAATVATGCETTFAVDLDTAAAGTKSGEISFTNNDRDDM